MTSIGITVHYNDQCRELEKELRIVKAIKKICEDEGVPYGIGYDKQTPAREDEFEGVCDVCGFREGSFECEQSLAHESA